jgi:hypothetical protein
MPLNKIARMSPSGAWLGVTGKDIFILIDWCLSMKQEPTPR